MQEKRQAGASDLYRQAAQAGLRWRNWRPGDRPDQRPLSFFGMPISNETTTLTSWASRSIPGVRGRVTTEETASEAVCISILHGHLAARVLIGAVGRCGDCQNLQAFKNPNGCCGTKCTRCITLGALGDCGGQRAHSTLKKILLGQSQLSDLPVVKAWANSLAWCNGDSPQPG
jgi:hypothetical protein